MSQKVNAYSNNPIFEFLLYYKTYIFILLYFIFLLYIVETEIILLLNGDYFTFQQR